MLIIDQKLVLNCDDVNKLKRFHRPSRKSRLLSELVKKNIEGLKILLVKTSTKNLTQTIQ